MGRLAAPLVWAAGIVDAVLHRLAGRPPQAADEESFEEEIRTIVSEGHREGLLEEEAREMIEGVIELGDAAVSHIMTPRTEIHMIQVDTPWEEVVESVIESATRGCPSTTRAATKSSAFLYSKDLLPELAKVARPIAAAACRAAAQAAVRARDEAGRRPAEGVPKEPHAHRRRARRIRRRLGPGDDRRRARRNRRRDRR